jgi:hypothetical protein
MTARIRLVIYTLLVYFLYHFLVTGLSVPWLP